MPLSEYLRFLTSEDGQLRTSLFESNVRDYQGDVTVNEAIENTLRHPSTEDFWWLNNGITLVAEKVSGDLREITLGEPQIVNGLQTSQKIYDYFSSDPQAAASDQREILLRIVKAPSVESHDAIIRATNSQTSIPQAYLWATSQIHRDIESYFRSKDLYYDRRKNSWRREGVPLTKVVGITELAQSVASVLRQEPDHARARPARYFGKQYHAMVFAQKYRIHMYVICAQLKKKATLFLRKVESDKAHRNNLLFYLMMVSACVALKTPKPRPSKLAELNMEKIDDAVFQKALYIVRPVYEAFGATDKAAKGTEMAVELRVIVRQKYTFKRRKKN
jgi:AIPR protein